MSISKDTIIKAGDTVFIIDNVSLPRYVGIDKKLEHTGCYVNIIHPEQVSVDIKYDDTRLSVDNYYYSYTDIFLTEKEALEYCLNNDIPLYTEEYNLLMQELDKQNNATEVTETMPKHKFLDRNNKDTYLCKYALIRLDKLRKASSINEKHISQLLGYLEDIIFDAINKHNTLPGQLIETCDSNENEFFTIKLKDTFAEEALLAYADAAFSAGQYDLSDEVKELAAKAGKNHPSCKLPD